MRFFTFTLTSGTLSISQNDGAMFLSVQCSDSSSCTIAGNQPFKNLTSTAVTLSSGQGINLSAVSPASPLDGITVTYSSGSIDILVGFG
jgi:hypothetical protein